MKTLSKEQEAVEDLRVLRNIMAQRKQIENTVNRLGEKYTGYNNPDITIENAIIEFIGKNRAATLLNIGKS